MDISRFPKVEEALQMQIKNLERNVEINKELQGAYKSKLKVVEKKLIKVEAGETTKERLIEELLSSTQALQKENTRLKQKVVAQKDQISKFKASVEQKLHSVLSQPASANSSSS